MLFITPLWFISRACARRNTQHHTQPTRSRKKRNNNSCTCIDHEAGQAAKTTENGTSANETNGFIIVASTYISRVNRFLSPLVFSATNDFSIHNISIAQIYYYYASARNVRFSARSLTPFARITQPSGQTFYMENC